MGFKCGIVGLPNIGKSTLFNALTESNKAEAANYPFATINPNIGRVPVVDERLKKLSEINSSIKSIPAYMDFIDIAGLVKGASKGEGLGNKFLSHIREVDAIAHVVRCFKNENISHVSSLINPIKDIDIVDTELRLADLQTLQKKYFILEKKIKGGDKDIKIQLNLIVSLIDRINNNQPLILTEWSSIQLNIINNLNLITAKPVLYVCNVDENSILRGNDFTREVEKKSKKQNIKVIIISAAIESQIAQLDKKNEKIELLNDLKLKETSLIRFIKYGYNLLNLITFFTSGPKETRAWTVKKNTKAPDAANNIHTDFKKGFIRAETISYHDYINYGSEVLCKEKGKMRQEGKEYIVRDGDIINFLFNV